MGPRDGLHGCEKSRSTDLPGLIKSLYQLSYPGPPLSTNDSLRRYTGNRHYVCYCIRRKIAWKLWLPFAQWRNTDNTPTVVELHQIEERFPMASLCISQESYRGEAYRTIFFNSSMLIMEWQLPLFGVSHSPSVSIPKPKSPNTFWQDYLRGLWTCCSVPVRNTQADNTKIYRECGRPADLCSRTIIIQL